MKKITPTIAKALAHRIHSELLRITPSDEKIANELSEKIKTHPSYKKAAKALESFKKVNTELRKLVEKDIAPLYRKLTIFSEEPSKAIVNTYMLQNRRNIPSVEKIKEDIMLEAFFDTENAEPNAIIEKYVNMYIANKDIKK